MALTLSDLQCLRCGVRASHPVGQIPPNVLSELGWDMPWVYLSTESCIHIFKVHSDLQEFDVLALPAVINRGLLIRETHRPRCLVASYVLEGARYIATMKRAPRCEIWVTTFHRSKPKQTKALLKRGEILRSHKSGAMPTLHYQEREGLQITLYNAPACPKLQIAELRPAESHRVTSLTKLLNHTDSLTSTYFFKFLSGLTRLLISEPLPPGQLDLSRDAHAPARIPAHGHARGHAGARARAGGHGHAGSSHKPGWRPHSG